MSRRLPPISTLLLVVCCPLAFAQEPTNPPAAPSAAPAVPPATHTVTKGPLRVAVTLSGVFESTRMTELSVRPKEWATLTVVEAVEQGAVVKQGDVLLRLETKDLDDAIADLERSQQQSAIDLRQAEEAMSLLEQSTPFDLAAAERAKAMADEDLKHYLEIEGPLEERSAHYQVKTSREQLEYAEEELKQLEKMYKADDLTEETEEIIVKRAQRDVENARFYLERATVSSDHTLNVEIPRQRELLTQSARRQAMSLEERRSELPATLQKKRLEVEQQRIAHARGDERLAKLRQDRELLTLRSPHDGIVFYGPPARGRWSGASTVAPQLRPFAALSANQTVITIVEPRPLFLRVDLAEKDLHQVRAGIAGRAVPTAFPDLKLSAQVERVSAVPVSDGVFDARIAIELGEQAAAVMPGMTANVELTAYRKEAALTVPTSAIFTDELDGRSYVLLVPEEGKHERRNVTTGPTVGDKTEVTEGLQEGDRILLSKPM
jgi:HlyD family secretion protein